MSPARATHKSKRANEAANPYPKYVPQSLANLTIHVVFSTKHRAPVLTPELREHLHAYMAGTLRGLGCPSIRIGGVEDHVHAFFALSRTTALATVVSELKTSSTHWLKGHGLRDFAWQAGYGAFAVGPSERDRIVAYIQRQVEHHAKISFEDEYRALLTEVGVEFDERYLWD